MSIAVPGRHIHLSAVREASGAVYRAAVRTPLVRIDLSDLRGPLRRGATDADLAVILSGSTWRKRAGHGINDASFLQPARPMSAIGG